MNIHPLRPRGHEDAARVAISWLAERHRKGWRSAFEALLDLWRPEGPRDGWQLDEDGMTMVSINAGEWLIARGEIRARGGLREINAYLLGREGPFLTPGQRDWIAQLRARPLRLYRVTDVQARRRHDPDRRVRPAGPAAAGARDQRQSQCKAGHADGRAHHGVATGAGIDGHRELSGAIYPFSKLAEAAVLAGPAGAGQLCRVELHVDNQRDLLELAIARARLDQWFAPAPLPLRISANVTDDFGNVTDLGFGAGLRG
ncbi:MAG: hypothetical protein IPM99_14135 [Rubrivivax sp.]|nr:hypothetical protein [Rubrivivax sp.]